MKTGEKKIVWTLLIEFSNKNSLLFVLIQNNFKTNNAMK